MDIQVYKAKLEKWLEEKNALTDALNIVEQKSGVKKIYIAMGVIAFVAIWLMVGYGAQFLANFIGFLYPAYCSVLAIESIDKTDDTKWLTYWVVYAFFSLLEFFTDIFLFWIPLYAFFKCVFLLVCMAPVSWNGSLIIYRRLILPFVKKHQSHIDTALKRGTDALGDIGDGVRKEVGDATRDTLLSSKLD